MSLLLQKTQRIENQRNQQFVQERKRSLVAVEAAVVLA